MKLHLMYQINPDRLEALYQRAKEINPINGAEEKKGKMSRFR